MTQFKAIATITWKFESDQPEKDCLEYAKQQLDQILESHPQGEDFDGFGIQVDLAKMKERKRLVHLGEFELQDVLPHITEDETKREYVVGEESYAVRMNSDRYFVFQNNHACVSCNLAGTKMILDINPGDQSPHFNLYGEENGRLVLMTKDHILAKSKGGTDELSNYQTCCAVCNNLKGAYDVTYQQVEELRKLYDNEEKLPRKELRDLINKTREEMARKNAEAQTI
jgi:hypothetical protein